MLKAGCAFPRGRLAGHCCSLARLSSGPLYRALVLPGSRGWLPSAQGWWSAGWLGYGRNYNFTHKLAEQGFAGLLYALSHFALQTFKGQLNRTWLTFGGGNIPAMQRVAPGYAADQAEVQKSPSL